MLGTTVAGILMKQITEAAPDVRGRRSDVPEDLALAVARCLEKDPENRLLARGPRVRRPNALDRSVKTPAQATESFRTHRSTSPQEREQARVCAARWPGEAIQPSTMRLACLSHKTGTVTRPSKSGSVA